MAGMKLNLNRSLSLIGMVALCVGIAMSSVNATNTQNRDQEIQTVQSRQICAQEISSRQQCRAATTSEAPEKKRRPIMLAGNQAACQWNYNQCMQGCNGAAQCSNACMTNYNNCMR
jgi:hypothetical protein